MSKFTLEVCADSVESVLAAEKGGADRIELCGNVVIGGTTPSESLFREIRRYSDIKIHALIRPRFGDFCYTEYEFDIIRSEVRRFRELGAQGVAYLCTAVGSICQSDVHPCQGGNRWCEFQSWNGISYWSGTCYGMGGSICNKETETGPEYDLPGWNVSDFIRNSNRSILALLLPGTAAGRSQRSGAD